MKNGLDRVMVVTSIPIPRFDQIQVQPIDFAKCAKIMDNGIKEGEHLMTSDTQAIKAAKDWCARARGHPLHWIFAATRETLH